MRAYEERGGLLIEIGDSATADQERAALYRSSAERHAARLREEARREWARFHCNMSRLHTRLAVEHRTKAEALLAEGALEEGARP